MKSALLLLTDVLVTTALVAATGVVYLVLGASALALPALGVYLLWLWLGG